MDRRAATRQLVRDLASSGDIMRILLGLTALALSAGAAAAAPTAGPPARPPPAYVVAQGQTNAAAVGFQQLTVICPGGRHALGGGYSALVQTPPKTQGGPPGQQEGGLESVRSFPDMAGTGWQVSGVSPDAVRLKQPWRLVVRVVCMQVPS
jgi:hypothetical protein